jgi:hypothetical protein
MAKTDATIRDVLNAMPTTWARTLMEVIASEGDSTERCLHHLQGLTVAVAALAGVPSEKLAEGLAAHIENFNSHFAKANPDDANG